MIRMAVGCGWVAGAFVLGLASGAAQAQNSYPGPYPSYPSQPYSSQPYGQSYYGQPSYSPSPYAQPYSRPSYAQPSYAQPSYSPQPYASQPYSQPSYSQTYPQQQAPIASDSDQQTPLLAAQQLEDLVAPVALYPDPLLSQVLAASTYPLELVEAQQWLQQNRNLSGQQLMDAAKQQSWDPSVQAMVAFPDALALLARDVRWTTDLGNAFLAQQADVMNAIQTMRARAQQNGRLQTTSQQVVTDQSQDGQTAIQIEPAEPEVMYVPVYSPSYVWGAPAWGGYSDLWYPPAYGGFGFSPAIFIGRLFSGLFGWLSWGWGFNWFGHGLFWNPGFFSHYGYHGYHGYAGGFGGHPAWVHDPAHRMGVPYSNRAVAGRFGGSYGNRGGYSGGYNRGYSGGYNQSGAYNRGQSFSSPARTEGFRSGFAGGSSGYRGGYSGMQRYEAGARGYPGYSGTPQSMARSYSGSSYGGSGYSAQHYSAPTNSGQARNFSSGFSSSQHYSAPSQHFSAPSASHFSAPHNSSPHYSAPHNSGGHSGGGGHSSGGHSGGGHSHR